MSKVRLSLPFPPSELSPNARAGWRKKARVVAQYREDCGWAVVAHDYYVEQHTRKLAPPVEASVAFYVPDRRKRDEDNLLAMLKPAWDGLVDAGVLAGDDHERFSVKSVEVYVGKPARVEVTLRGQ